DCPSGGMDGVLMPGQMMLQSRESLGPPRALDPILGDGRNFAGTSFVTLDIFGSYRTGSALLSLRDDPDIPAEVASVAYDGDGTPSARTMVIEAGVLKRPLGGGLSAARAAEARPGLAIEPVATARASGWNRAPIDRMSNLNIEPGDATLEHLVGSVD